MSCSIELLPAPEKPTIATVPPSSTAKLTPSSTCRSPRRNVTSSNEIADPAGVTGRSGSGSGGVESTSSILASSPRETRMRPPRSDNDSSGSTQRATSTSIASISGAPTLPPSASAAPSTSSAVNTAWTATESASTPGTAAIAAFRPARRCASSTSSSRR